MMDAGAAEEEQPPAGSRRGVRRRSGRPDPTRTRGSRARSSTRTSRGTGALIEEIVWQPVVVRRVPPGTEDGEVRYELIMGERRWRASRAAGKDVVPAIIKVTEEDDLLRDALLENLHRSQLNALEEAAASSAARRLRLHPGGLAGASTAHARRSPTPCGCSSCRRSCSAGWRPGCSVPATPGPAARPARRPGHGADGPAGRGRGAVRAHRRGARHARRRRRPAARRAPRPGTRRPQLDDLAADLSDRLETRVRIALGQRKGRLTVEFASVEDLNRILDAMHLREHHDN